jgi:hypothetical protein
VSGSDKRVHANGGPDLTTRDPEQRKAYEKRWREENKDRLRALNKAWRAANADALKTKKKAYYERTREERNALQRADRKANPEKYNNDKVRAAKSAERRLRHSKFDAVTYKAAIALQGNCCAICRTDLSTLSKHRVHADHCHATQTPRGVLCGDCNMGLGMFKESPERLQAAIDYLRDYPLRIL